MNDGRKRGAEKRTICPVVNMVTWVLRVRQFNPQLLSRSVMLLVENTALVCIVEKL